MAGMWTGKLTAGWKAAGRSRDARENHAIPAAMTFFPAIEDRFFFTMGFFNVHRWHAANTFTYHPVRLKNQEWSGGMKVETTRAKLGRSPPNLSARDPPTYCVSM